MSIAKRVNYEPSPDIYAILESYRKQKKTEGFKETLETLIRSLLTEKEAEKAAAVAVAPVQSQGSPPRTEQPQPPQTWVPPKEELDKLRKQTVPLEAQQSAYPIHPSRLAASQNSKPALSGTSQNSNSGNLAGSSQKQSGKDTLQERWQYKQKCAQLRVETAKKIEEAKQVVREQVNRYRRRPLQEEISRTFAQPCPKGLKPNDCVHNLCERRHQCHKEGILTGPVIPTTENPQPFKGDMAYVQ